MSRTATASLVTLVIACTSAAFSGCNTSGPNLSGIPIGNTRIVSVGDVVTLSLPLREDGGRAWRVTSYDSLYLSIENAPRLEADASNKPQIVTRVRAKTPGVTHVELEEVGAPADERPDVVRFRVRITQ